MNAGELRDKVTLLSAAGSGEDLRWETAAQLWVKAETLPPRCPCGDNPELEEVAMTMRRRALAPCTPVEWNGKRGMVLDVAPVGKQYSRALVRMAEPKLCAAMRPQVEKGELNRPVTTMREIAVFPGYLEEKEPAYTRSMPQTASRQACQLTTPKREALLPGDLVRIGRTHYTVAASYTMRPDRDVYDLTIQREQ